MEIVTSENIIWKSMVLWSLFTDPGESMETTVKVAKKITLIITHTFCHFRISKICPGLGECSFLQGIPSFPESFPTYLKQNPSYLSKAYSRDIDYLKAKKMMDIKWINLSNSNQSKWDARFTETVPMDGNASVWKCFDGQENYEGNYQRNCAHLI